ncbi:MAG: alpha/beta hydrolase [Bacteroidales bacterium]|nr:alpha/beta hydrolase [Bacteroidales bacterium]
MNKELHNYRLYGRSIIEIIVLHGGPGAPGNVAPLARELSKKWGVLEPFQNAGNVIGQIQELHEMICEKCNKPIVLIGHSWGAWLAFMFSGIYPDKIKKLILIGAGPFEEHYATDILETRLKRMTEKERDFAVKLMDSMQYGGNSKDVATFEKFGKFMSRADAYDRIYEENEIVEYQPDIFYKVWSEAIILRRTGILLQYGEKISCPVVAIHGDYDPHPADGVRYPLSNVIKDFTFLVIEKCGHEPWNERQAKDLFFNTLIEQIEKVT